MLKRMCLLLVLFFLLTGAVWAETLASKSEPESDVERIDALHTRGTE